MFEAKETMFLKCIGAMNRLCQGLHQGIYVSKQLSSALQYFNLGRSLSCSCMIHRLKCITVLL